MPALNFMRRWKAPILNGTKWSTMRRTKRGSEGQLCTLYVGMRTKACETLAKVRLTRVVEVTLGMDGHEPFAHMGKDQEWVRMKGRFLSELARQEGFQSTEDMFAFFTETYGPLPWSGWLHEWDMVESIYKL